MVTPGFAKRFGQSDIQRPTLVAEYLTATEMTHDWANLTGWTSSGVSVNANRLIGNAPNDDPSAAATPFAVAAGDIVRVTAEITRVTGDTAGSAQFVGVNFGGASNGVIAGVPNFVGVGIWTANNRPTAFVGANCTGVTTGGVNLGTDNLVGTFRVCITVDDQQISMVVRRVDGSQEWSHSIPRSAAPNSGAVTSVLVWNGESRATAGSYIKAIGARKSLTPFRTRTNAAGTIEGNTGFVIRRNQGDVWRIHLPKNLDPMKPAPVVLYTHYSGGGAHDPMEAARMLAVTQALEDAGYIIISANDGGNRWGNAASVSAYQSLLDWTRARLHSGKVFLFGVSMGGLPMLNLVRHRQPYPIAAALGICPACDLVAMYTPTWKAAIDAAYGSTDLASLLANSAGYNPMSEDPALFRRVPFMFNVGASDTTVPPASHAIPFEAQIAPHALTSEVNVLGTGHATAAQYDVDMILDFYESYRG